MQSPANKLWPYSGVLGVAVIWGALLAGILRAGLRLTGSSPLSDLGINPASDWLFSGGLLVSAGLFILFAFYVRRHFNVHNRFLTYFLIGQAGQIVAAIFPYGQQSNYRTVHTVAAFTLALSLPFLMREFAHSQTRQPGHSLYRKLLYFELATFVIGMGIFTLTNSVAPIGQALPAVGFHLWIIVISLTPRRPLQVNNERFQTSAAEKA